MIKNAFLSIFAILTIFLNILNPFVVATATSLEETSSSSEFKSQGSVPEQESTNHASSPNQPVPSSSTFPVIYVTTTATATENRAAWDLGRP